MHELTPQQKEALEYKKHVSLTANAGSGKTFVLSKRFVEIFLNEDIELNNIVAITFTEKAASELNRKIATEIEERLNSEKEQLKIAKLHSLRRQLVSANISTIHSFCISILREFSPEAEIDANFLPIDQTTSDELIDLTIEETLNGLIINNELSESLKYLIRFYGSKKIFSSQLRNSIYQRNEISALSKSMYNCEAGELARIFKELFENNFSEMFSKSISAGLEQIKIVNDFVSTNNSKSENAFTISVLINKFKKQSSSLEKIDLLRSVKDLMLTQKGEVRSRGYLSAKRDELEENILVVEDFFSVMNSFFNIDDAEKAEYELAVFGKTFIKIFEHACNLYSRKKTQKGYLDFEDLLLYTKKVIDNEEVKKYLRQKYKYIMIDEYQDTNELQYEIFMPILDNLKSGNLFIVGDEKQSIYMFRNAELEIFERTKSDIDLLKKNGSLLSLPHSFRMSPPLVLFTNYLFSNLFKNADAHFNEVEPNNLICAKNEDENGLVEFLLAEQDGEITEAELTAAKIIEILNEKENSDINPSDIAILCRKRDSFAELEKIFIQKEIPYSIIGGKGFYQRQTIYDVYNYLSFLLNNDDDAALIGVLRSPFFYMSDFELFDVSNSEGKSFFEKLKIKSFENAKYNDVYKKLSENINTSSSSEVYALIRKILLESGYWSVIAAKRNASQELANIEKLLAMARNFTKKSFKTLYDFTVTLRESIEGYEDEGQAPITGDTDAVKLMTIHQAKGLEFKVVILYGCNNKAYEDSVKARTLSIDKKYGLLAKVPINKDYFSKYSSAPIASLYNYTIHRKNLAEVKRLLYVAVTRAVSRLYISATTKNYETKRDTFLDLILHGLNFNPNDKEKIISSEVEFMKFDSGSYNFYKRILDLKIPIIRNVENQSLNLRLEGEQKSKDEILVERIKDIPKNEIISATKISMFTQCPVKYQLTYQIGYSSIYNLLRQRENDYEFNDNEDDELKPYSQLRGRIIHLALKHEVAASDLAAFVSQKLSAENLEEENSLKEKLAISMSDEIKRFYESTTYIDLRQLKKYKNEIEIYCEEGLHYLYGIIDKLEFMEDRLVIVDYKTDNIGNDQLTTRAVDYLPQLKFYAYILSKLYPEYLRYELRLIFLKQPENPFISEISKAELENFGIFINQAIEKIYTENFVPNLTHCSKCHFALKGNKCVKPS